MVNEPTGKLAGISVATPVESRGADPTTVVPLVKVTVPVGVGSFMAVGSFTTVATRITSGVAPEVVEEPRPVIVGIFPTT
jgi:hypothetical protein